MHQVKVDIFQTEVLKRRVNALGDTVVPGVVELGGNPDLLTRNTRVTDTLTNLGLVSVCQSTITLSIDVPVYRRLFKIYVQLTCRCGGSPSAERS